MVDSGVAHRFDLFILTCLRTVFRRATVGRIPLDEWSARLRDLYLTTHNTHNRQTDKHPCPRWDLNPQSQQAGGPETYNSSLRTQFLFTSHSAHCHKSPLRPTVNTIAHPVTKWRFKTLALCDWLIEMSEKINSDDQNTQGFASSTISGYD